ncbi:MAG: diguanylate cyclase [Ferrovum sp.]|nr:diguanylate cyclase [Ferrovum sp.]
MTHVELNAGPSEAKTSLLQSDSLFRQMFEHHTAMMLLIDPEARIIIDANIAASHFYGYSLEALRGMDVTQINAQAESEILPQRQQAMNGEKSSFTFEHRLANNEIRTVEVHISTIHHDGKTLFFSIIHDITERKHLEEQILNLAFYDPLTKLPNRRLLNDRLEQAMPASKRSGRYVALMLLDLDNFKNINDLHGHTVGDMLLVEVAKRLKSCVREIDTVARFGGDEFVVILSHLDLDRDASVTHAYTVAEKIRTRLEAPYAMTVTLEASEALSLDYSCPASIGVVVFTNHEATEELVLKWADTAMYQAKESGGNRVRFHDANV